MERKRPKRTPTFPRSVCNRKPELPFRQQAAIYLSTSTGSNVEEVPGVHAVLTGADVPDARYGRISKDIPLLVRVIDNRHEKSVVVITQSSSSIWPLRRPRSPSPPEAVEAACRPARPQKRFGAAGIAVNAPAR